VTREGDPSAVEDSADLVARYRWQVEGQQGIFVRRSSLLLDRCAASARGTMPHLRLSDPVRPTARADKAIE